MPTILHALLLMTLKADKFPLETEPVPHDNNMVYTLKPCDQAFVVPYLTDNSPTIHQSGGG